MLREPIQFPLELRQLRGQPWHIAGWLSAPPQRASDTLLILIHGGSYTHAYWDMPFKPEIYSCVEWCYKRGIATLNIDRLGCGESSYPPGKDLTMMVHADSVSELIAQIRASGIGAEKFKHVVTVGHSLGSLAAALAQATHKCADAVVLTGLTGVNVTKISTESVQAKMKDHRPIPATQVARLASKHHLYDEGYICDREGYRVQAFFRVPPAEEGMIAADLALEGAVTVGEMMTSGTAFEAVLKMEAPVLVQFGEFDTFFYDPASEPDTRVTHAAVAADAPENFTIAPIVENAGHNLAQHPNAHASYEVMRKWVADIGL